MAPSTAASLDIARAAEIFHALSDEIRLEVVALLLDGERCVCELMDELEMAQSKLSWHLKTLRDAGVVNDRKEGRWVYYSLNAETLGMARGMLEQLKPSRRALRTVCC